jgi:NAD(P)-dependent dehydrogenase (short-subunit alcohol dehydrogenase family)
VCAQVLSGGVAVISGGASGIGFALAARAIAEGIHVAIADIGEHSRGR